VKVCNLSARQFLVTIPNVLYWLSFLNLFAGSNTTTGASLRDILERLCCRPFGQFDDRVKAANYFRSDTGAQPAEADSTAPRDAAFGSLLWNAVSQPNRPAGVEHVLLGILDARDADGQPFLSRQELAHPSEWLMLNQVVAPLVRTMVPQGGAETFSRMAGGIGEAPSDDVRRELGALRATIDDQRRRIEELERRG
jgi:hypothetical protein